jgi:hypothetical protein
MGDPKSGYLENTGQWGVMDTVRWNFRFDWEWTTVTVLVYTWLVTSFTKAAYHHSSILITILRLSIVNHTEQKTGLECHLGARLCVSI